MKVLRLWSVPVLILGVLFSSKSCSGNPDFRVVGYLPAYRFAINEDIDWEKLTHVCLGFAHPSEEGYVLIDRRDEMIEVIQRAKMAQVKVMISLGGGGLEEDEKALWYRYVRAGHRTRFIQNLLKFIHYYKIDGVDVDLEWKQVNEHYNAFVLELRDSLDQHDKILSAALPGWVRYKDLSSKTLRAFDFVNIMAYDLTGPWKPDQPGQHAPYAKAKSSVAFWKKQGVPARKITLGVPFFGWDFTDREDVHSVTFRNLVERDSTFAFRSRVGEVYYNGISLIEDKVELAVQEVGGVMIWELGQDDFGRFSLLNRINKTLIRKEVIESEEFAEEPIEIYPEPEPEITTVTYPSLHEFYVITDNREAEVPKPQQHKPVFGETMVAEAIQPEPKIALSRMGDRITLAFKMDGQKRAYISMPNYPAGFFLSLQLIHRHFFSGPSVRGFNEVKGGTE